MYMRYLFSGNEKVKTAFVAGCRAMMEVLAHAPADSYKAILSRDDPDWLLMLLESEQARKQSEQERIVIADPAELQRSNSSVPWHDF